MTEYAKAAGQITEIANKFEDNEELSGLLKDVADKISSISSKDATIIKLASAK